jgi:methylmalonyl-CoA mutase C-terminal domain/subunit
MADRKIRVLVAKPGLDGHDRGAKIISRALRDAGMEVIYTGIRQTVDQIVSAAIQEDVDLIGLSCLSGAHLTLFPKIIEMLRSKQAGDIAVIGGGIIPNDDIPTLKEAGVKEIFQPGTSTEEIVQFIQKHAQDKGQALLKGDEL